MRTPRRILVVRTDRLGDVVLATPLIRALRETFPDAFLGAMVQPYARDVLLHNPHLNEIFVDDPNGEHAGRSGFWRQVQALRARRYDTALLLLPTERTAWMLFFAGIARRIGVGTKFYGVLTGMGGVSRKNYTPLRHEADYCLDLGRRIGVHSQNLATEVFLTEVERRHGRELLAQRGINPGDILIGLHIGNGNSAPNWPAGRYGELATLIVSRTPERIKIVYTDGKDTPPLPAGGRIVDLRNALTLRELMSVLAQYRLLFSSSTGPMHIAAALRIPTISLFCPLTACSPTLWGPQGNEALNMLPPPEYCSKRCPRDPKICPLDEPTVHDVSALILDRVGAAIML